jgi:hypothetical protein
MNVDGMVVGDEKVWVDGDGKFGPMRMDGGGVVRTG